ncbi:hypothetical protein [Streptomyces sp. NPDC003006]
MTRPTPSRPRLDDEAAEPELRTDTERDVEPPDTERESRPDTDLREDCDRDEREDAREEERALELPDPRASLPPPVTPVGGEPTSPFGATTGARPHVSQYSSPPPTSSYDPGHPGR